MNCPDQKRIIANVTDFIHNEKGNIVYIDQYVDRLNKTFYMRIEVEVEKSNKEKAKEIQIKILKRIVLIRALKLHAERKVMIYSNKTIIFN